MFNNFKNVLIYCLMISLVVLGGDSEAAENILQGSISLENSFDSNVFQTDQGRIDEWQTIVSPELSYQAPGRNGTIDFKYSPEFSYNHRRDEEEMAQDITVSVEKSLSSYWQVRFSDNYTSWDRPFFEADTSLSRARQFLRVDAATQAEIVRLLFPEIVWDPDLYLTLVLSEIQQRYVDEPSLRIQVDNLLAGEGPGARQRYWTNNIFFESVFQVAENSVLTVGYGYEVHDNKTGIQADRTQHSPNATFSYRFNPQWNVELGYLFEKISLDSSDDSETHNPNFRVNFQRSDNNLIYFSYDYDAVDYEGETTDVVDQSAGLGWEYGLNSNTNFESILTTTYLERDTANDQRGVDIGLRVTRNFEKGVFSLIGDYDFTERSTGSSWHKLGRSYKMESEVGYNLTQKLSSNFNISYEKRLNWDVNFIKNTFDDFELGASLEYNFLKVFSLVFGYDYHLFDTSNADLNDYYEHLVSLKLVAVKELWRW